jgi:3-deoxy-D-manno-octulosonate 8-phosphate phosphatase (KDO 8-P phosphatase)
MLLMDVDGVLTDGRFFYSDNGVESKAFDVKDGFAIRLGGIAGLRYGIITGKMSNIVERRARELGIEEVHQGYFNKVEVYNKIKERCSLFDAEIAYIGDDLFDMGVMKKVGFSACPADAVEEVKGISDYIAKNKGGRGAVREVIELILKARGKWEVLLDGFIQGKLAMEKP